jgi:hypothetical protein
MKLTTGTEFICFLFFFLKQSLIQHFVDNVFRNHRRKIRSRENRKIRQREMEEDERDRLRELEEIEMKKREEK